MNVSLKPTKAFVITSWAALALAVLAYGVGLLNANLQLNEKGYYLVVLLFGLFSVITLQKTVRDEMEGINVTALYRTMVIAGVIISCALMLIGLWNASTLALNEKGFFAITFALGLFSAVVTQKNVRDLAFFESAEPQTEPHRPAKPASPAEPEHPQD
ncbi:inner membrane protein YiaA [Photobacterium sp. CCB-ST2H9]|uniref:inner membrane protein YiaA n=1 Tax=Photobacterium sp. CCB-ST2H9 TaxID=2912855 RepID=UPI002006B039|nr:inner membrane protein YiaA [Photobacterium sp. CCB-ST2H9]UTM60051.1 inner membrane protein YiaA [Photobacterium sp. CCB-ST2H9]